MVITGGTIVSPESSVEASIAVDGTDRLADIVARHASDVIGETIGITGTVYLIV